MLVDLHSVDSSRGSDGKTGGIPSDQYNNAVKTFLYVKVTRTKVNIKGYVYFF